MEERISFQSSGLKINGVLHCPTGMKPGERRPAFIVLHGFGSNCSSSNCVLPAQMLTEWGYAALRFDFRGCGESEGKRANTICLEQVQDTSAAVSFLQTRPEIDPARIAVVGSSFGAAVGVYTGGVDERVAAGRSFRGWGDSGRLAGRPGGAPAGGRWAGFRSRRRRTRSEHRARTAGQTRRQQRRSSMWAWTCAGSRCGGGGGESRGRGPSSCRRSAGRTRCSRSSASIEHRQAARQGAMGARTGVMSTPRWASQPSAAQKSRCMSTTTSAVRPRSRLSRSGSAARRTGRGGGRRRLDGDRRRLERSPASGCAREVAVADA